MWNVDVGKIILKYVDEGKTKIIVTWMKTRKIVGRGNIFYTTFIGK